MPRNLLKCQDTEYIVYEEPCIQAVGKAHASLRRVDAAMARGVSAAMGPRDGGGGATPAFQRELRLRGGKPHPLPSYVTPSQSHAVALRTIFSGNPTYVSSERRSLFLSQPGAIKR